MKIHFEKVEDIAGFVVKPGKPGDMIPILVRAHLTSDETDFYNYIEQISRIYLNTAKISADHVFQFVLILHQDLSADLYVNNFAVNVEIRSKKELKQGEEVMLSDIADIRRISFPDVTILETDKIIFCFKAGWRFGLFFDLSAVRHPVESKKLDIDRAMLTIGALYRYLSFYHVYKVLESGALFETMLRDGWFPFIEILEEYKELSKWYQDKSIQDDKALIAKFDLTRINKITEKWWKNPIFASKKTLIQAGVSAYLQETQEGYINCIKNLCTEIEGILRELYRSETGEGNVRCGDFIAYVIEKGSKKGSSEQSLFMTLPFLQYLKEVVFANFDVNQGKVELSRHSSCHGVAEVEKYTKERALQMILILDQIFFYI